MFGQWKKWKREATRTVKTTSQMLTGPKRKAKKKRAAKAAPKKRRSKARKKTRGTVQRREATPTKKRSKKKAAKRRAKTKPRAVVKRKR